MSEYLCRQCSTVAICTIAHIAQILQKHSIVIRMSTMHKTSVNLLLKVETTAGLLWLLTASPTFPISRVTQINQWQQILRKYSTHISLEVKLHKFLMLKSLIQLDTSIARLRNAQFRLFSQSAKQQYSFNSKNGILQTNAHSANVLFRCDL